MAQPSPFSNVPTTNDIASQRKLAQALMTQGTDASPVGHWTQALARAVQGGVGGYQNRMASDGEKSRQNAIAEALKGSSTFGSLGANDQALLSQDPDLLQSVAGKAMGNKLDPNAGKTEAVKNYEYNLKNPGFAEFKLKAGDQPMNIKEWNFFKTLSPEDQQRYITVKRGDKYLNTDTAHVLPNNVDPTAPPRAIVQRNLTAAEVQKGTGQDIAKTIAEQPEARQRLNLVVGGLSRLRQGVEDVQMSKGLGKIVGGRYQAHVPNVSSDALDAQTDLENLKVKISGTVLQTMKDMSKTGGAVGQVTEKEWPRLENMLANLDPLQSKEKFQENLNRVLEYTKEVETTLRQAHAADVAKAAQGGAYQQAPPQQPQGQPVQVAPQAVKMLQQNPTPQARAQFDEVFGPGAADRALGGM